MQAESSDCFAQAALLSSDGEAPAAACGLKAGGEGG